MIRDQDPMVGLSGLQKAIKNGYQMDKLVQGTAKDGVRLCSDMGGKRLTFAKVKHNRVQAYVCLCVTDPLHEKPCFCLFYAVPEKLRGHGQAEKLYRIAIHDMTKGFPHDFYVEAIVDQDNEASNHLAKKLLGTMVKTGTDKLSGKPINSYHQLYLHEA